jgi:ABC-2 type transport system ATP-binding protein
VGPGEVAVLPDTPRFDPWLTGSEVVALAQHLTDPGGRADRVDQVLAEAGVADAKDRRVGGYSRGMLQRLGVACTLVGRPRLVLLDEPASALDPQGRREVLDLIARFRGSATVLFSSHILGDVQEVCDTVGILDDGSLRFQGSIDSLLVGQAVPRVVVRLRSGADRVVTALTGIDWVTRVESLGDHTIAVAVTSLEAAETRLPAVLASTGAAVISFRPEDVTLEQAFLELTR